METQKKDYIIKVKFVFEGELKVYASSKDEAKQMVRELRDDFRKCSKHHSEYP